MSLALGLPFGLAAPLQPSPASAPLWFPGAAERLRELAREAGRVILSFRESGTMAPTRKQDGSPVTLADHASQKTILDGLAQLTPQVAVIAEEKENPPSLTATGTYWLVDPLDGTRDYVEGGDEFSVSIGLIVDHEPYLGVIYVPMQDDLFYGDPYGAMREHRGETTYLAAAPIAEVETKDASLITSRRERRRTPIATWLSQGQIGAWKECSSAYKFGLLAAGEADIFLRTGPTYEWDTAAGDALLRAVGGRVVTPDNAPLAYGKPTFLNSDFLAHTRNVNTADITRFARMLDAG
jgi:3'(2'), 5'-bisphosphate nucleotidase